MGSDGLGKGLAGAILLLISVTGCGTIDRPQPLVSSSSQDVTPSPEFPPSPRAQSPEASSLPQNAPAADSPIQAPSTSTPVGNPPAERPVSQLQPDPNTPNLLRDYAPNAPIPATGQVTIRGDVRQLDLDRLIADCPADSAPYALAESTGYFIQICSAEYDPWLPKYYIGQAKDGSGELRLTNDNPDTARQLIFPNDGYTYTLYRDSARPDQTNAYLEVGTPDGKIYAEALFYLYERLDRP